MFRWKEDGICTAYKCPTDHCPFYLRNLAALTDEERQMRADGSTSQFKLRYLFRDYHFASDHLAVARPENAPVDLNRIHNNLHTVGLCLTFSVSFGLSARMTAQALKRVFDIPISHQTVINYINASAAYMSGFVDANCPVPKGICAADETYIKVEGITHYTWLIRFCVSISWRSLFDLTQDASDSRPLPHGDDVNALRALDVWREFLLGDRDSIDGFDQHLAVVGAPTTTSGIANTLDLKLYFERAVTHATWHNPVESYVFTKMCRVVVVGTIKDHEHPWRGTLVQPGTGVFSCQDQVLSGVFSSWIRSDLASMVTTRGRLSCRQHAVIDSALKQFLTKTRTS